MRDGASYATDGNLAPLALTKAQAERRAKAATDPALLRAGFAVHVRRARPALLGIDKPDFWTVERVKAY